MFNMTSSLSTKFFFKFNTVSSQISLLKNHFLSQSVYYLAFCLLHKSASSFVPYINRIIHLRSILCPRDYEIASWHLGNFGYGEDIHTNLYSNLTNSFKYYNRFYSPLRSPPH